MAVKKIYLGSQGPYLFDDTDDLDDADGDFTGQKIAGIVTDDVAVAQEFIGIPVMGIEVANVDDPSTELNPLSASDVGGLLAAYEVTAAAPDEFTLYLWDTDAGAENVPYTVDGSGGTWVAVSGKYINSGVNIGGPFAGAHTIASHSDTTATGAELNELTGGGDTILHDHDGIDENTTHRSSNGTDHGYIDQDLQTSASPTFAGLTKVGGASDYTEIEADGTIEFHGNATVWDDANVGGVSLGGPVANRPGTETLDDEGGTDTGIYVLGFGIGDIVSGAIEIPHSYKEGSDIVPHIHWQGNDAPSGTDYVKWELTYTVSQHEATLDAATTITIETAYDTQYEQVISAFAAITGTNFNMGDQFIFSLERVAAAGDAYSGNALVMTVGLHFEKDTVGSRQITTK